TYGFYSIDPDGNGSAGSFNVYCDMTANGGGWTLIMKAVNASFLYIDVLWEDNSVLNENDFNFTVSGSKSKYRSFNTVSFKEIRTSDTDNFANSYIYNTGNNYANAKALFSGPGIQISSGSLNAYFNDRTPANGRHWSRCGSFEPTVLNVGINQDEYLDDYGLLGGGGFLCNWGGSARFGQRVNGYNGGYGNMQGQGWGTRYQQGEWLGTSERNFPITQLLWVR
ncbi:hypothetical protein HY797_01790, partial [Candidatus Falkowbacteria bacterium]|nr:hypothetical protein [Candidatus Falkowbacteria bacterium]